MVLHVETNTNNPSRLFLHGVSSGTLVGYASNIADNLPNLTVQRKCGGEQSQSVRITGLSATASSSYGNSSYYSAGNGIDGDTNTWWVPNHNDWDKTFTVALNGSYKLDTAKIKWYQGYEGLHLVVLTSTDGVTFGNTLPASAIVRSGDETSISFANADATHIRIRIREHNQFVPILMDSEFFGRSN
jgi:hypothetical protein